MLDYKVYLGDEIITLHLEDHQLGGVRARFVHKGRLASRLNRGERFELFGIEAILQGLKDDSVFLDIGAGIGYYSVLLKLLNHNITVWGFEPCRNTYDVCIENIELNKLQNIIVNRLALSNYKGKGILKFHEQDGLNTLGQPFAESKLLGQEEVGVTTLDLFLKNNNIDRVDIIKADIEGGELRLFQGAIKLLSQEDAPIILFENVPYRTSAFGHKPQHVEGFLKSFGYKIRQISAEMFEAQK